MKAFRCDYCGALAFFEDVSCIQCGHRLGFLPDVMNLAALEPDNEEPWESLTKGSQAWLYRACANGREYSYSVCNGFVPAEEPDEYCAARRLNALVPDVSATENQALWRKIEAANETTPGQFA